MNLQWTGRALFDLARLENFLGPINPTASVRAIRSVTGAAERLLEHPRIGYRLDEYAPREIRRVIVGVYELRYEIVGNTIFVMRIWHAREDR